MGDRLLSVKAVASRFDTTEAGMRWKIHIGEAPRSAMFGGRRMFRESDVDAYIEAKFSEES